MNMSNTYSYNVDARAAVINIVGGDQHNVSLDQGLFCDLVKEEVLLISHPFIRRGIASKNLRVVVTTRPVIKP
jgi:hypothetical protein